ncbi:hypothetical protein CLU85_1195 [Acidovorax sp. 69]|uniref:hypothetical protein n=1 Tax=Acidovorax sp. 69 TaxID=2035202 RepID=UPI000C24C473|nr:hypothetical protein [Acidovorax sp. 69]PJI96449.1 hypothetical protein CLU85_1195 [Acidovorax sp. 69]
MTAQEPQYTRAVFEGLLDTLDVVLTKTGKWHVPDSTVRGNYDIRDDGVWLRKNDVVDALNWTPVCDLEEGFESPDPLATPALPFPFTARQLAAFMLGGWGWHLGERFSDGTGVLNAEVVPLLLSGQLDAKLRESITSAFSELHSAQLRAPSPDPEIWLSLARANEELDTAETAAEAANDWTDKSQPGEVQEKRRLAYLAAVNPYRQKAREAESAHNDAQDKWRKAIVRDLLKPHQVNTAPMATDRASIAPGNVKVWTDEKLAEMKAFRDKHGTKKTAERFGVSTQLIRRKLPSEKHKPQGYSAFTQRLK